jgi:hypothetical protein
MRWREAEAAVEAGDRPAAIEPARSALEIALRLGARWLAEEIEALAQRARLQLEAVDLLDSQGDSELIFDRHPARPNQSLTVLHLTAPRGRRRRSMT